jgi:lipopolysaccharide transport system ATP-binding protein
MKTSIESDVLISCEGVSKKFCKDFKRSLWYGIKDVTSSFSRTAQHHDSLRKDEFWAVKDISFELRRGECLGLIGHNGAGKSTLLKILNGLITPDQGQVTMKGRVGALIELGAGFNPVLTGRENIYNNGAVLGFSKAEITAKLETIIDFSELRDFIDMPVQNYSSGMKVRLGFAVAAQMEPDILLIDEVLAVGDLGFKLKCFKTIDEILPNTAIIFVSHSMPMVSRICSQIILMDHGCVQYQGTDVARGIDLYYNRFGQDVSGVVFDDQTVELLGVHILDKPKENNAYQIEWNSNFKIDLRLKTKSAVLPRVVLTIIDSEQRPVALIRPLETSRQISSNQVNFSFLIQKVQLSKGLYTIDVSISDQVDKKPRLRINSVLSLQIVHELDTWPPFLLDAEISFKEGVL